MSRPMWGDTVRIKESASTKMHSGALAEVCGMREVETAEQAEQFGCGIGTRLYLVEFGDGASLEIPEIHLELAKGV